MTTTLPKTLPKTLISMLDKQEIHLIDIYLTQRKIDDAYDCIKDLLDLMPPDDLGTLVARLNRAYLDGDFDDQGDNDDDSEVH